ncbi:MAG: acyl carrier protein [Christensenellaceae bacterium]|jgi:acyl carrier protein|nr:acyl carrier protein [Christensenellaceae bacterium]
MVFEKIRSMLAEQMNISPETITLETRLSEDLKADSLDLVELIMDLEQEYSIQIPEEELPNIHTVGDIAAFFTKE